MQIIDTPLKSISFNLNMFSLFCIFLKINYNAVRNSKYTIINSIIENIHMSPGADPAANLRRDDFL